MQQNIARISALASKMGQSGAPNFILFNENLFWKALVNAEVAEKFLNGI